jgi:hypothetical protein
MFSTTSTSSDDRTARAGGANRLPLQGIDLLQEVTGGQPVSDDHNYRSLLCPLEMRATSVSSPSLSSTTGR